MKRKSKIIFGSIFAVLSIVGLSSCTKSFCSNIDTARMMYACDPGITKYSFSSDPAAEVTFHHALNDKIYTIKGIEAEVPTFNSANNHFEFSDGHADKCGWLNNVIDNANEKQLFIPNANSITYFKLIDELVLGDIIEKAYNPETPSFTITITSEADYKKFTNNISYYSYLKYVDGNETCLWTRWLHRYNNYLKNTLTSEETLSGDFISFYRAILDNNAAQYRTCIATTEDKYGTYGYYTEGIFVEAKSWKYAWNKGFFEGLLVYPIGWMVDSIAIGFNGLGATQGVAALLSIFFVTLIIRLIMMFATIKQTAGNAKMTELQPQVTKIQNKYPNANTNQYEKQRMAQEINELYKKNKINPLTTLLVLIIQFPVFICVWGALSGSSILTNGSFLGLSLGISIKDAMFAQGAWTAAGNYQGVTAFFLFLLMAAAQTVSMLLPQWMQKKKAKQVAKLGKNPSQKSQDNKMKWITYIMLIVIIFMGFSLVSAMGVYWFIGALISIGQTFVMQAITARKSKKNN